MYPRPLPRPTLRTILLLATSSLPPLAHASTYTWQSPTDALWSNPASWSPTAVPTSPDDAFLNLNAFYTATLTGNRSVNSLTINAPAATLLLQSSSSTGSASLTTAADLNLTAGHLQLQSSGGYSTSLSVGGALTVGPAGHLDLLTPTDGNTPTFSVAGIVNNSGNFYAGVSTNFNSTVTNYATLAVGSSNASPGPVVAAVNAGIFVQSAGTLYFNDNTTLRIHDGGFVFDGGSIQRSTVATPSGAGPTSGGGSVVFTGESGLVTSTPDGGGATFSAFNNFSLYGDLAPNTNVHLSSNSHFGYGNLYLADNATNRGTISLHADEGYSAYIHVGDDTGNLNNAGTLNLLSVEHAAPITLYGTLVNTGTVNVDNVVSLGGNTSNAGTINITGGATLSMGNARFNQDAGTLGNATSTTHLNLIHATFNYNGGHVAIPLDLRSSSTLHFAVTDGQGITAYAYDTAFLTSDLPTNSNLYSISNVSHGYQNLLVPDGFTNRGNLTIRADDGYAANIQANNGAGAFTNAATMNLATNTAANTTASTISGAFVNAGTLNTDINTIFAANTSNAGVINVGNGATLSMSNARFNQDAGSLGNAGTTNFNLTDSTFNYNGGLVFLTVNLFKSSTLNVPTPDGHGVAFNGQQTTTLAGDLPQNTLLTSTANAQQGYSTLVVQDNATNRGHIFFHPNDGYTTNLRTPADGGNFNNAALLEFSTNAPGSSSAAVISTTLVNTGTINADVNLSFAQNVSNAGNFNVGNNANLSMSGGARFNQDAGHLGNSGNTHFRITGGGFNFNGGSVGLTVDLYGGSYLSTAVLDAGGAAFNFFGNGTLRGNLAPGASVFSVANVNVGYANLFVDANAHNYGSITLSALNGYTNTLRVGVTDAIENFYNNGSITYNADADSQVNIYGNVVNAGSLNVAGHTTVQGTFSNSPGSSLHVDGPASLLNLRGGAAVSGQLLASNGAKLIATGGGNVVSNDGGSVVSNDGGSVISNDGGSILAHGGSVVSNDGGSVISNDGGSVVSNDGGSLVVGAGGSASAFIGHNGSSAPTGVVASATTTPFPQASIVAQSNGTISLQGGTLHADNLLQIDAGGTLTGFGTASAAAATAAGTINPTGGTLTLHAPLTLSNATVTGPGKLLITAPLTIAAPSTLASTVAAASLTLAAPLDLTTSTLTLTTADPTAIRQSLLAHQLFSSLSDPTHTLGYAHDSRDSTSPASLLIQLTLKGDANLDGTLNADDYALLDRGYARQSSTWQEGDFNYDGIIDNQDYLLIDATYLSSHPSSPAFLAQRESQFGAAYVTTLLATVPEPTLPLSSILYPLSSLFLPRRRRPLPQ